MPQSGQNERDWVSSLILLEMRTVILLNKIDVFTLLAYLFAYIESDKINLERENKKIKAELMDGPAARSAFSGNRQASVSNDIERLLQQELVEKNKVRMNLLAFSYRLESFLFQEIAELRQSQSKVKKMLSEANVEISHIKCRAEQVQNKLNNLNNTVKKLKILHSMNRKLSDYDYVLKN